MKFKNKEELSKAYDELEKAYTKECQENKKLREQLNLVEKKEIWQPKDGERYWYICPLGDTDCFKEGGLVIDRQFFEYGNHFKTQEEAEKQAEYNRVMNRFRKYVEAYSEPLDWNNASMNKWCLCYKYGKIETRSTFIDMHRGAFQIYASNAQVLKNAIIYSAGSEEEFIRIVFGGK